MVRTRDRYDTDINRGLMIYDTSDALEANDVKVVQRRGGIQIDKKKTKEVRVIAREKTQVRRRGQRHQSSPQQTADDGCVPVCRANSEQPW
jgi:hypothetical protein